MTSDPSSALNQLETDAGPVDIYRLDSIGANEQLPKTIKILLENLLRRPAASGPEDPCTRCPRGRLTTDLLLMPNG